MDIKYDRMVWGEGRNGTFHQTGLNLKAWS